MVATDGEEDRGIRGVISLFPYQIPSAENLLRSLRENRVGTDLSDGGAGKMYVNAFVAAERGEPVGVVCPKVVVPAWRRVLAGFGIEEPLFVCNWEKLRAGNTGIGKFQIKRWEWSDTIPKTATLILDEAHYGKGLNSLNARIMMSAKPYFPLMASATLAESPIDMRASGYLLGFHNWTNHFKWCLKNGCWRGAFGGLEFKRKTAAKHLLALHEMILPKFGSRIRKIDHPDIFPPNHIVPEAFDFSDNGKIQAAYDEMEREILAAMAAGDMNALTQQLRARQKVESLKVPGIVSMARDLIDQGKSVVIFTNFRETLTTLREKLKCAGIYGGQSETEREKAIADFQADKTRCIICNVQSGGVGVSLHDLLGEFPRVSLVCPTFSAKDLIQALQRIHRAGVQSQVLQYIVFAANTVEEKVCARVKQKMNNINLLNDGDLDPLEELADGRIATPCCAKRAQVSALSSDIRQNENIPHEVSVTCHNTALPMPPETTSPLVKALRALAEMPVPSFTERKHAPLSPSVLKSKAICPGFFSDPSGDKSFADRGTLGHKAVETEDLSLVAHDPALKIAVEKCIEYKHRFTKDDIKNIEVHQEVRLNYFDQFGYADLIVVNLVLDRADIVDWKFAVNFYAADTPQFHAYALGAWNARPELETIRIHAVHPFRDEIDIETFTRAKDYERLSGQVAAIIARARANRPEDYTVSAQCQYCGLAGKCTKLALLGAEIARRYSPEIELPDIDFHGSNVTDPAHFEILLRAKPIVEKAAEGWSRAAMEMHDSGTPIPGCEVTSRAGRKSVVSARGAYDLLKKEVAPALAPEDFIDICNVNAGALDDLVKAAAPARKKGKTVEHFNALLMDNDLLTQGGGGRYIRPSRK